MSGISGIPQGNHAPVQSRDVMFGDQNRIFLKEIADHKRHFADGTLRDQQMFDTVEKIAQAIERGDRVSSRVLIDALQMILNVRAHFDLPTDQAYRANVDKIATKLGSALKGPMSEELFANPWVDSRARTQQEISGIDMATRFADELTRRGFVDAGLHLL